MCTKLRNKNCDNLIANKSLRYACRLSESGRKVDRDRRAIFD